MLLALAHAAGLVRWAPLEAADAALYDVRLRAFAQGEVGPGLAVVGIDERALAEVGRWPWPRAKLAELVDKLGGEQGAALIGLDMILAEPEAGGSDGDARLAAALRRHAVVLGLHLDDAPHALRSGSLPPPWPLAADGSRWPAWTGYSGNLPALQQAAAGAGFLNAALDADGVTRRAPLLAVVDGGIRPSLALAMARALRGDAALSALAAADAQAQVLIPFPAPRGQVQTVSAADVLGGRLPAKSLAGRAVIVGPSAAGTGDRRLTPMGLMQPGVELHANLLWGLATGRLARVPAAVRAMEATTVALLGAVLLLLLPRCTLGQAALLTGALAGLVTGANFVAWTAFRSALPLAASLVLAAALFALHLAFGQLREALARRRLAALFGHYVPPELVAEMARDPERYSMEGRAVELTVLFADVRGFTTFSEKLTPTELAALMNRYFSVMTDIVRAHRGTLDKYVGDALMAFWGAPVADPDHAEHAVRAALEMQAALPALNREFAAKGWPEVRITIGINSGPMVVGDMGSRHRRAYTVLGDAVNVAARLQELSGKLEVPVLIGEATRHALPAHWACREVDRVTPRGRSTQLVIFQPLPPRRGA